MALRFTAAQDRLNKAVIAHLSNEEALLVGTPVAGLFDNGYAQSDVGLSGMSGSKPSWTVATADVPLHVVQWFVSYSPPIDPLDLLVTLQGTTYKIVGHEPDGTGLSRLLLEVST